MKKINIIAQPNEWCFLFSFFFLLVHSDDGIVSKETKDQNWTRENPEFEVLLRLRIECRLESQFDSSLLVSIYKRIRRRRRSREENETVNTRSWFSSIFLSISISLHRVFDDNQSIHTNGTERECGALFPSTIRFIRVQKFEFSLRWMCVFCQATTTIFCYTKIEAKSWTPYNSRLPSEPEKSTKNVPKKMKRATTTASQNPSWILLGFTGEKIYRAAHDVAKTTKVSRSMRVRSASGKSYGIPEFELIVTEGEQKLSVQLDKRRWNDGQYSLPPPLLSAISSSRLDGTTHRYIDDGIRSDDPIVLMPLLQLFGSSNGVFALCTPQSFKFFFCCCCSLRSNQIELFELERKKKSNMKMALKWLLHDDSSR